MRDTVPGDGRDLTSGSLLSLKLVAVRDTSPRAHDHEPMLFWDEVTVPKVSHRDQHPPPRPLPRRHAMAVDEMMLGHDPFLRLREWLGEYGM